MPCPQYSETAGGMASRGNLQRCVNSTGRTHLPPACNLGRDRTLRDLADHASKDDLVDRVQTVPVDQSPHALRREVGGLREERLPRRLRVYVELPPPRGQEPSSRRAAGSGGPARPLRHARNPAPRPPGGSQRGAPAAPHPDATHQPVDQPAQMPHPVHIEPAAAAAQPGERGEHCHGVRRHLKLAVFQVQALDRAQYHRRHIPLARHERVAPHGFHLAGVEPEERQLHRGLVIEQLDLREDSGGLLITHDHLIA